jgi:hypothetical protein
MAALPAAARRTASGAVAGMAVAASGADAGADTSLGLGPLTQDAEAQEIRAALVQRLHSSGLAAEMKVRTGRAGSGATRCYGCSFIMCVFVSGGGVLSLTYLTY